MNTRFVVLLILLCGVQSVFCQIFSVTDGNIYHEKSARPCLTITLDPEPGTLKKAWKDFVRSNYEIRLKGYGLFSNRDILSAKEVNQGKLSQKPLNVYTQIISNENGGTDIRVFASFNRDTYINEKNYPSEYKALKHMLEAFVQAFMPEYYQNLISNQEEKLDDLKDKDKQITRKVERNGQQIVKLTKENEYLAARKVKTEVEIGTLSKDLEENKQKLKLLMTEIDETFRKENKE